MTAAARPQTRIFGIRHHGPGSARSVALALRQFGPDTILIEGPADADALAGLAAAEGMSPPVALLAYVPNAPATAAFWPFAVFSPEWQALRYAAEYVVPVHFCDLPATHVLAHDDEHADRSDPLAALAAAGGYDDPERWWDAIVESTTDATLFDALTEAMAALRDTEAEPIDPHTLRREAYMRQVLRRTLTAGARRVAVVCGAWHAPALAGPLGPAAADARLLRGLPRTKATLTWVPWTHSRLSGASGYGAGITSPGWYHHLFDAPDRPVVRWFTAVATTLRGHDLPVSSAHVIESVRLAETLAALRNRPLAGLSEVTDAARAVLCDGDESLVRMISAELVIGEALGTVPDDTPTVPLAADLRTRARTLRLGQEATTRRLDLDLRRDRDLARSRLLHQLRILGIAWGTPASSSIRGTGTFRETWTLRWEPELPVAVVEASRWGTTIAAAARTRLLDRAAGATVTVGELAGAIETALLADLAEAVDGLVTRLGAVAALDHDVSHLLAALPGLVRTVRYGDVRSTDTAALARVADGILIRICAGLPSAVTGVDTDAAAALRDLIDATHLAVATRDDPWATGAWLRALGMLADRPDIHPALAGRAVRLLSDAGVIDENDSARRLSAALSLGHEPIGKAAWIDGFLGGRGLLLVHDRSLLRLIDGWLRGLDEDRFVATLPLLRRTFGAFEAGERRAIADAVRGPAVAAGTATPDSIDPDRGRLALTGAVEILAVAR